MSSIDTLASVTKRVSDNIEKVIEGKRDVIRTALTVLLAEGHLLIEDVPGVGKTMLAKALARSVDCTVKRIQFTPDLLPSDVTGVSIYNRETRDFEFRPGGVFANVVADDDVRENPAWPELEVSCLAVVDRDTCDVRRQQVRRELDALDGAVDGAGQRLGQHGLPDPGNVLDEQVPLGEQDCERGPNHVPLALDHLLDV